MGGACNRTCLGVSAGKRDLIGFPSSLQWLAPWLPQPGLQQPHLGIWPPSCPPAPPTSAPCPPQSASGPWQ